MAKYSFALSDKLCKEYMLFKQLGGYDKALVSKLLRYHTGIEFIYNNDQLGRVGITVDKTLSIRLKKAGFDNKNIEDLSKKTEYKLILTDDNSNYPYVNINNDNILTCITGCFLQNDARNKAVEHIRSLCANAREITIYDAYLHSGNNIDGLKSILPNKNCTVNYVSGHILSTQITDLESQFPQCTFNVIRDTDTHHHDRYIIIDRKLEIMLSSGFQHFINRTKDLTYVVRPITSSRF